MYILKDAIADVPINKDLEVELIQGFMDQDDYVLICSYDYLDEEIRMLKEEFGELMAISNKLNSEIRYGNKPCVYENINDYSSILKKDVMRGCKLM
ncbi:hypothetical protein [Clostridium beijerinckii]|uniref:Uncharacterized protein n=1 Tax=Clostridium beijerinckii TaxID=1520 RepID=A0AAX0AWH2_CLOBE|nr:hypothetical protein [Clostridium beijerinckii]NRT87236.1 hypothetical protein [Clostridium beijerinckii]NYC72667.1 hypothetical protein [Clostridium beijerinckii]